MGEVGEAYEACRERVSSITAHLDEQAARTPVPACPGWCVRDVVAHLTGVVDDVMAGRLLGVATDPWTHAQVDARRGRPLPSVLSEWANLAPPFVALLDSVGDPGRQAVADAVTHEHDIRGAIGRPGSRDSDAVAIGLEFVARAFVAAADERAVAVLVQVDGGPSFGRRDAPLVLTGDAFALLRAMTGRKSEDQLLEMDWSGDSRRAISAFRFGPFRPSDCRIDE